MNEQILLNEWQQIKSPTKGPYISNSYNEFDELKKKIHTRNRREIITAIVLIPIFGCITLIGPSLLSKIGSSVIVLYCLFIVFMLRNKKDDHIPDVVLPSIFYLSEYLHYLKDQSRLLNTVLYWYILPPMAGLSLFVIGLNLNVSYTIIFLFVIMLVNFRVFYKNRQVVLNEFNPKIAGLKSLLAQESKLNHDDN